ncbi:hypothetical protein SELMODRAFT_85818 [Selaginella moellendorffii]|uniref:non-specific serine/threonine protein kinase n=1 Tax=Selaginella moellendorffii TaxID=88036 RepID=D8R6C7_SELML|nr:hypothetical protein SELMODRAFT_85818 [Selaginella moellendorffii]
MPKVRLPGPAISLPWGAIRLNVLSGNALAELKSKLWDPKNALRSWDANLVNPCSWLYVDCDSQQRVITVMLEKQGLSGTLSPALADLPNLQNLRMKGNLISGSLPPQLGTLQGLLNLDLSANNFTGSIPSTLTNLTSLRTLLLNNNSLTGSIPSTLTLISSLQFLDVSYNNLSGPLPPKGTISEFNLLGNPDLCGTKVGTPCPESILPSSRRRGKQVWLNIGAIIGGIAAGALFLLLCPLLAVIVWRKHRGPKEVFFDVAAENDPHATFGQLRKFTLRELQIATDNFSDKNVLGQGGFGKVYKGSLENGKLVAVKRLRTDQNISAGGEQAFQTEVEIIGLAVHRNLLRLDGFCITPSERILVYPFMPNGSVASRLRKLKINHLKTLDWETRKQIALGAAHGLRYLHVHCSPRIIHRDVKAANVLLDKDFQAVVGDFGLAKLIDTKNTHITTNVRGTPGHIAPEYLSTGKSSEKTDVFGYGVLMLELITGKRAFDLARLFDDDDVMLLDWVKRFQQEGRLSELVDPKLRHSYQPNEVEKLTQIALLCTQASPSDRPKMVEVVSMLEGDGLAERWEEWQKVQVLRREEVDVGHKQLDEWMMIQGDSSNLEAIELSGAR